ncbi:hypothetical protein [Hyphomicrobium sp.]|uniref:hypothetical protein n=1 Tax=Hyphomicrobium sp. TaxID=82 RepID=UPI002FE3471B
MLDQNGNSHRRLRIIAAICLAVVFSILAIQFLRGPSAVNVIVGVFGIGLFGLIPQVLPPNTFRGQKALRVVGWIWFLVPTAAIAWAWIAVLNGAAVS